MSGAQIAQIAGAISRHVYRGVFCCGLHITPSTLHYISQQLQLLQSEGGFQWLLHLTEKNVESAPEF